MTTSFELADFLPYQLATLAERVSRRLAVEYEASHGLTVAEWRVLANLQRLGQTSVRDIQVVTNLEKSRVSRAVGRLEKAGLVKKRTSQQDGRLVEIGLTPKGQKTLDAIVPKATAVEQRLLDKIDPDALRAFYEVVETFHAVLDEDPDARPRLGKGAPDPNR